MMYEREVNAMFLWLKKLFRGKTVTEKSIEEKDVLHFRVTGNGERVSYSTESYGSDKIEKVEHEPVIGEPTEIVGKNGEKTHRYPAALPFMAAGKCYLNWKQLCGEEEQEGLCTDVYGREVLYYKERFPCFDSFDYLHEHRYFRWFLLRENGGLTRVHVADESGWINVTENVVNLEYQCTKMLKNYGWIE